MVVEGPFGTIDLGAVPDGMSNAALMAADRSADGHPQVVFGPQTGYFAPQLLTEQAVVAPGIRARGVSFAGTSLVVQLGHGVDYAWSATSAGSDLVDTVVVRLCEPGGGTATLESEGYLDGDSCVAMDRDVHEEVALPTPAAPAVPQTFRFLVLRTEHGIVQLRTTVDGAPVAVVTQRSTYGRELDSALGFERLGNPDYVQDAADFREAAAAIDYTFNWFYVDDRDIAYYSSGRLPLRADGVDAHLPRWGDAAYDWQGWLATDDHPQQVNPPSGYLVSWNNKQAPGFGTADDQWGYGPVHRSEALSDRMADLAAAGGVTTTDMVAAVQDAATVDSRAVYTLPSLLDVIGDDPALADATALLRGWQERGAHRLDQDRDGAYEEQAAIALFDTWWGPADGTEQGVAQDLLRGTLGDLVAELPQRWDDHPRQGLGSSWNGVAWYGYVLKDLDVVRGTDPGAWSQAYCGGGDLAACQADLRASLRAAVDRALAEQGVATVAELTYDKHIDDIRATTAGVVGVRDIDWQNRPTFQQVVHYTALDAEKGRAATARRGRPLAPRWSPVGRRWKHMQPTRPGRPDPRAGPAGPDGRRDGRRRRPRRGEGPVRRRRARPGRPAAERRRPRPVPPARPSSTSPRPPSRPRCSTAPSRCRSCSTCGPSGAARASSSPRCWSGWPPRAAAPGCWRRSTSTPTRRWPRRLRVQGIPAVKAVWQGQLVAEFNGAIPEEQARQFVDELVKATTGGARPRRPTPRPSQDAEDPRLDAAEAALERGDLAAAEAAYQAILDAEPDHPEAGLALRQVQLFRRADEAGPDALAAADAAPDDVAAQTRAADFLLGTGNVRGGLRPAARRRAAHRRARTATRPASTWSSCSPSSGTRTRGSGAARRQLTLALF